MDYMVLSQSNVNTGQHKQRLICGNSKRCFGHTNQHYSWAVDTVYIHHLRAEYTRTWLYVRLTCSVCFLPHACRQLFISVRTHSV